MTRSAGGRLRRARLIVAALSIPMTAAGCTRLGPVTEADALTTVRDAWIVSEAEAIAWHQVKDRHGPAFTGNDSWQHFLAFVEEELRGYGVVDLHRNAWNFQRWQTSEWPDRSGWSLVAGGSRIEVASYGANSGDTGTAGVIAPLVIYDLQSPPTDLAGRIVVFQMRRDPSVIAQLAGYDYEYRSPDDRATGVTSLALTAPSMQSFEIFAQLLQTRAFIDIAVAARAAGALFVFDAGREQMAGLNTFPVPRHYPVPTLYLDRNAGSQVIRLANTGATATLRLDATVTDSTAYQLIGFLPGRAYGSPDDEIVQLTTHTDGPSISQDNGALGLLGVIRYLSHVPRARRPRTLMVFLDCRHYMPGQEAAFADQDWFARHPEARERIVGMIGMEHLGQLEFIESGDAMLPTGRVGPSTVWSTDNERMVALAIKAVRDNGLPSAFVRIVNRPGVHGRNQGPWYGMAKIAGEIGVPAFATMGMMGGYWATSARIDRFDAGMFRRQVATFAQLTGELMVADLDEIRTR